AERLAATRRLTARPFGVNLFLPGAPAPAGTVDAYRLSVAADAAGVGAVPGKPRWDDDAVDAKLALLLDGPPALVSFTLGLPGARAAALGTAFLDCPEAGTSAVHRAALRDDRPTALTRAFTGRTARGIVNGFLERHDGEAPAAYPEVHHVTAPLRQAARASGR